MPGDPSSVRLRRPLQDSAETQNAPGSHPLTASSAALSQRTVLTLDSAHTSDGKSVLVVGRLPPPSAAAPTVFHHRPVGRNGFQIAIVCALPLEYDAVFLLFDEL